MTMNEQLIKFASKSAAEDRKARFFDPLGISAAVEYRRAKSNPGWEERGETLGSDWYIVTTQAAADAWDRGLIEVRAAGLTGDIARARRLSVMASACAS